MPTPVQSRLMAEAAAPRIVELYRALAGLKRPIGFMNTGAHPDDETSAMLAALWLRDGVNLSYACSTRGEGGQNDIGTEAGPVLGALRTAEMERAAAVLDMRLYWHGQSPEDPVTDFGFSKSGVETMGKWGRARLMQRFVEILRLDRPDIVCPTFLDIPGQHGHHRAMTAAAHEVIGLAADPDFVTEGLEPWQVSKLYLPAWSGAGGAYDDEVPPPPATVTVQGRGRDPVLGFSHERIGQMSRQFHRTQGMGHWVPPGAERDWPLHLVTSTVGTDETAVTDNLPADLADLGVPAAQAALSALSDAFPDASAMVAAGFAADRALAEAEDRVAPAHRHRLARKRLQVARVIRIAAGVAARARPARSRIAPGEAVAVTLEHYPAEGCEAALALRPGPGQSLTGDGLAVAPDAPPADTYPDRFDPLAPRLPALAVTLRRDGQALTSLQPLEVPVRVMPAARAHLLQDKGFLNLDLPARELSVEVADLSPGTPRLALPEGWAQDWQGGRVTVTAPADVGPDLIAAPLTIDGIPARSSRLISHDHIDPVLYHAPAGITLRLAHVALPKARIGYVGAGTDSVAHWLRVAGFDLVEISDADLAGEAPFDAFDSVIVGVFAFRFRASLKPALPSLHDWVRAGGTLVTLYHRPSDEWDPDTTPPARLEIGKPSLRWRITDETAEVTLLAEDHPVLARPNRIGPADWQGWHKERGLYFAKSWDKAYTPILRLADPDEQPLDGGLLIGRIGRGRHAHVALNLHHQVTQLVPGAYRLFANLLSPD